MSRVSISNNLILAYSTIKKNRGRTLMSMAGVAIGVVAVIVVAIASQSGKQYVFNEFKSYGLTTLWVYRKVDENNPEQSRRAGSGLDNELYLKMKQNCCPHVRAFSAHVYPENWKVTVKHNNSYTKSSVEGVDVEYLRINNDQLLRGRNLRDEDISKRRPVGLVTLNTIKELFGSENVDPIGKTIEMEGLSINIVGVVQRKDRSLLESLGLTIAGYDVNNRVLLPYTLYQKVLGLRDIQELLAEASTLEEAHLGLLEIKQYLKRYYSDRFQYVGQTMQEWVNTANKILSIITLTGSISALAALLVGGVGIYNIMSLSVTDRTREIGLRRAVGATVNDIRSQFLIESALIGLAGGLLGIGLALIVVVYVMVWIGMSLGLSWLVFIVAPLLALATGVVAGYKPAMRAAGLSPMEALRYEN